MTCTNCQREITNYSNYCYFCGSRQNRPAGGTPPHRLERSAIDRKLAGVCGGVAEYFGMDATIVRLLWVLGTFFTGIIPGVVAYLVGWAIMPVGPLPIPMQPVAQSPGVAETPRASA